MDWIWNNWQYVLLIFWVLEKVVKLTPLPYDDILVDVIFRGLKSLKMETGRRSASGGK